MCADPQSVASPSVVVQPTPLTDSNSVSPDSSVNVSSPVSFDSPFNGADMEEMVRLLVFPVGMMISDMNQNNADKQRRVEQSSFDIEQSTENTKQSVYVE
mgnify:CR=1 FL=1